jgi:hypothetical protein
MKQNFYYSWTKDRNTYYLYYTFLYYKFPGLRIEIPIIFITHLFIINYYITCRLFR